MTSASESVAHTVQAPEGNHEPVPELEEIPGVSQQIRMALNFAFIASGVTDHKLQLHLPDYLYAKNGVAIRTEAECIAHIKKFSGERREHVIRALEEALQPWIRIVDDMETNQRLQTKVERLLELAGEVPFELVKRFDLSDNTPEGLLAAHRDLHRRGQGKMEDAINRMIHHLRSEKNNSPVPREKKSLFV